MYKVYGIPNCDTVKKILGQLRAKSVVFEFIDYKKNPPTLDLLQMFKEQLGELPVNKKGQTYRKIKDIYESSTESQKMQLLIENSSAIKRPIITLNGQIVVLDLA